MSVRDCGFTRYALAPASPARTYEDDAAIVIIGAPPTSVTLGLPGARDEVLAYAGRVGEAVEKTRTAFVEWLRAKWGEDVPPDDQVPPTEDERAFIAEFTPWYSRWKIFRASIEPEWWTVLGPSPSKTWQDLEIYERDAEDFRRELVPFLKATPSVKPPPAPPVQSDGSKGYEEPGGVKAAGLGDVLGTIETVAYVVGGAVVLYALASAVGR